MAFAALHSSYIVMPNEEEQKDICRHITALCTFLEAARVLLSAGLVSNLFAVLLCLVLHLLDI